MRSAFLFVSLLLLPVKILCAEQDLPPDLKIGANFVWHVANCDRIDKATKFQSQNVKVELDQPSLKELTRVLPQLKQYKEDIVPEVVYVDQKYILGEQYAIFAISSKSKEMKFFEVHLIGKYRPLRIKGIKELTFNEVYNSTIKNKTIAIPQDIPQDDD
jgi:hypothetical protein